MWKEIGEREFGGIRGPNLFRNRIKSNRIASLQLSNHKELVSPHRGSVNSLQLPIASDVFVLLFAYLLDMSMVSDGGGILYEDCRKKVEVVEKEDDDLSMVSDASSGPPHFLEDEECFNATAYFHHASEQTKRSKQKKKIKEYTGKQNQQNSYLDDTASSHFLCFSQKNIASSYHQSSKERGFAATHFKGKKHFNFFEHSTEAGNAASEKSVSLQERKRQ